MSLFTDNKLTDKTVEVRFYRYSDPYMGWGDTGTVLYAEIPVSAFEEKEENRFDGSKFYEYSFTEEWYEKLKKTFGNYWWSEIGYELSSEKKKEEEAEEYAAYLARYEASKITHRFE